MKLLTLALAVLFISSAYAISLPADQDAWTDSVTGWSATSGSITLDTVNKVAGVGSIQFQFLPVTDHDYVFNTSIDVTNYDTLHFWTIRLAKNINVQYIRFYENATNYYQYDIYAQIYGSSWTEYIFNKVDFNATGSPDWSNISSFEIRQSGIAPFGRGNIDKMYWYTANPSDIAPLGIKPTQGGDTNVRVDAVYIIQPKAASDDYQHVVGKVDVENFGTNYRVAINTANKLCYQYSSGGSNYEHCSTTTLSNNTGYTYGFSVDAKTGRILLYLNGSLDMNETFSGGAATNTNPITIGQTSEGTGQFFGTVDRIRIFDYAMTGAEIATNLASIYQTEPAMFNYDFDIGSIVTAFDTHFQSWDDDTGIVMRNGDYDDSLQCVSYDAPAGSQITNPLIKLILQNMLIIAALMLFTGVAVWWVWT